MLAVQDVKDESALVQIEQPLPAVEEKENQSSMHADISEEIAAAIEDAEEDDDDERTLMPPRTIHEEELPPPEPLESIQVDTVAPLEHIGFVWSVVDDCVVVQGKESTRALIEGVVLCLDDRRPLGRIFEVFGPVKQPHYMLRVDKAHAPSKGAYAYVTETQKTFIDAKYISTRRACDASDMYDEEIPEHLAEVSDDELEISSKSRKRRAGSGISAQGEDDDSDDDDEFYLANEDDEAIVSTGPPSALLAKYINGPIPSR